MARHSLLMVRYGFQTAVVARSVAAIRETDDGLIPPTNRAASRTPVPIVKKYLAFSILALGIGGRPNRIDKLRAAACPRRIRSRRPCRRCSAIVAVKSNIDIPFEVSVSIDCSSMDTETPAVRQVSMKETKSGNDFPIRHNDQINTRLIVPLRIASISAASPGRRSVPRTVVGRSVNIWETAQPRATATAWRRLT
jgi:hypothetical protein